LNLKVKLTVLAMAILLTIAAKGAPQVTDPPVVTCAVPR